MNYFDSSHGEPALLPVQQQPKPTAPAPGLASSSRQRPSVRGKFLFVGDRKFFVKGISYGAFRPDDEKREYHDLAQVDRDFALMAAHGFNTVRIPHTMPPRELLDIAQLHGLMVMVGLSAEQYVGFLIDREKKAPDIKSIVREKVRSVAGHPALLCYGLGNEIPAPMARWIGRRRLERYIHKLFRVVKEEDPEGLVTYVNYPTTEFLQLPFLDFVSFNVYLEDEETLRKYLARLHNIAGDRPLLMSEVGLDAMRNSEEKQAEVLDWQVRASFSAGCAGVVIFSWTDEWFRGGSEVDDWAFGLTDRERNPKPALAAVEQSFHEIPFPPLTNAPRFSVIVCTHNGTKTIRRTLDGLKQLEYPDFEVIVVNDGSTDETAEIVSAFDDVRLITTENRGLSSARNTGLHAATGRFVAYIDDDAWPDPHWLHFLAFAFENSTHSGIGGPNIAPRDSGFVEQCVSHSPGGPLHVLLSDEVAEHIPGCNMAFRKADLEAVGGFDPVYRAAGDDVDVCWKIQECGWTLGFHPAAMVWHRRRDSILGYLKQQRGYGKAEALLESNWPEKYNCAGHVCWQGRVYGNGLTHVLGRVSRVYHGFWGTAPFQGLHESAPHHFFSISAMPEWWLVIAMLTALTVAGISWLPLLAVAAPLLTVAVGTVLVQAAISVHRSTVGERSEPGGVSWRRHAVTFGLHLAQPIARLYGRIRTGLIASRRRVPCKWALPRKRKSAVFTEEWIDPWQRLRDLEKSLKAIDPTVARGGDFDRWDLEIRGGFCGAARLLMAVEDQGSGTQYVRVNSWPVWRWIALLPIFVVLFLAAIAAFKGAWLIAGGLGLVGLLAIIRGIEEAGSAQSVILDAVKKSERKHS